MPLDAAMALIDNRAQWTEFPAIDIPRHPAEKYLAGWTIVLDPGHGGEDGGAIDPRSTHKRGPTGVREADMNLRVGVLLKRLLEDAGVHVIMTREADDTISLRQRAEIANNARKADGSIGADLFISLHHNAVGNRQTNYTSVWYHGPVDVAEPELDIAKYIAHELGKALRTDVGRTSPILDDKLMYDSGFGVLRACNVSAVLLESSFYTNPEEEQRLRDAGHNLREAYAVYVGLCEYAYGGRPTQSLPQIQVNGSQVTLTTTLDSGLPPWWGADRNRVIPSSIQVYLNDDVQSSTFDSSTGQLHAVLSMDAESLSRTEADGIVRIHHANMFKHHNFQQRYAISVNEAGEASVKPLGPNRASSRAISTTRSTSTVGTGR